MTELSAAGLVAPGARIIDAASGRERSGAGLAGDMHAVADEVAAVDGAVFLLADLSATTIVRYLGTFVAERPVALLDPETDIEALLRLVRRFRPGLVLMGARGDAPPEEFVAEDHPVLGHVWRNRGTSSECHPDLAVLLPTSGSTGSPKLVRLSRTAVLANARSIATALGIDGAEIAPTSLPFFYSYGLSVLNSHLISGATVVVAQGGVLAEEFWTAFETYQATSLAGVPYNYELLHRIRWTPARHPTLRTLTQAGGRMRPDLIQAMHEKIDAVSGQLFVMYGQTEATARIAILPPSELPARPGSVGPAIPGGHLSIATEDGSTTASGVSGEVVYDGPNVMMGYAEAGPDLARGDELGGRLVTGDIGHLDGDRYLYLTGRIKRIAKIFGVRVNLTDIEALVPDTGPVAAISNGDGVVVWCEGLTDEGCHRVTEELAGRLRLHRSGFDVRSVERLPLLGNGKIDYGALEAML